MTTTDKTPALTAALEQIAAGTFPSLTTQNSDRADFAEVSRWGLKAMLLEAYLLGIKDAKGDR